ncbi:hypothetical protein BRDID11002_59430 [Bradyrhizobium diazoefficiens]|uniref:Uncharacterized protein n=1 Tax=Bradyrhizobium diazoefficiens TaxID=1355477 RepID=A0A809WR81_9BRAD|nr:hypothetical protein XF1B_04830 [Bradyrhizobium diazoefficiens]BCF22530.1 hypothetical protein XF14B_04820 [Bradyrhizobium diazoefficiens]
MAIGNGRPKRDLQLIVEKACDVRIQQWLVLRGPKIAEAVILRNRNPIVEERPDPFDIVAAVPTKIVRDVG